MDLSFYYSAAVTPLSVFEVKVSLNSLSLKSQL